MRGLRSARRRVIFAALLILPSLALAEVSVQLDGRGNFRRYWYLAGRVGRSEFVWRQVRPNLPQHLILNPLGDNLGDRAPVIQVSPVSGYPWVVWPKNFGNIRQLAYSTWEGRKWMEPAPVTPGVPLIYDDTDPALAIDQAGSLFLVWSRAEQTPKIYFSTMIKGRWTPALLISDPNIDSRAPSITLNGTTAVIKFRTPAGPVTRTYETAVLIESGANLMDNPIPPLSAPPTAPPSGDGPTSRGDSEHKR